MITGTLPVNQDTTMHDLFDAITILRNVYGTWDRPHNVSPEVEAAYHMYDDQQLWIELPGDARPDRLVNDFINKIDSDNFDLPIFNYTFRLMVWDAAISYRERSQSLLISIQQDRSPISDSSLDTILGFQGLSYVLFKYHGNMIINDLEHQARDMRRTIFDALGMDYYTLKRKHEEHLFLTMHA